MIHGEREGPSLDPISLRQGCVSERSCLISLSVIAFRCFSLRLMHISSMADDLIASAF
jgi:hypothetical protein